MERKVFIIVALILSAFFFNSCISMNKSIKSPNNMIQFEKNDFEFSEQVVGQAQQMKILGIDWANLFKAHKKANLTSKNTFSGWVVGTEPLNSTQQYALYNLLENNPGYDVVVYPYYETNTKGFLFFYTKTEVTVKARLAKIKK